MRRQHLSADLWDYLGRFIYAGATIDFKHKPTRSLRRMIAPPPPPPAAPATITCPDGLVISANQSCPSLPPPPPAAGSGARARSVTTEQGLS